MNHQQKDQVFADTLTRILNLNKVKAGEYAANDDAIANFRQEALDNNLPMETIWRVFANKHWRAISRFIADKHTGINRPSSEPIQGRIDDMIVYLLLLTCILNDPYKNHRPMDAKADCEASPLTKEELTKQALSYGIPLNVISALNSKLQRT